MLAKLAVDFGGDCQGWRKGNFIGSCNPGAHRSEAVQPLAEIPLLMSGLQNPCGYVVEDCIAKDILASLVGRDILGGPADHNRQLRLVIQLLHKARVAVNPAVRRHGFRHPLGEIDGDRPLLPKGIAAETGRLLRMITVIDSQTDDILPRMRDRSKQGYHGKGQPFTGWLRDGAGLNQGLHAGTGQRTDGIML